METKKKEQVGNILVALKDKYPKTSQAWQKRTDALADMLRKDMRPLNMINGEGFKVSLSHAKHCLLFFLHSTVGFC